MAIQGLNNRIISSDLLIAPELRGGAINNHLAVDGGELRIGNDLNLAEASGSDVLVELIDGTIWVGGNVATGSGHSRLTMRGGVLQVDGGRPIERLIAAALRRPCRCPPTIRSATTGSPARLTTRSGRLARRESALNGASAYKLKLKRICRVKCLTKTQRPTSASRSRGTTISRSGRLTLRMKYDDGFVAYLNGQEIGRVNAPGVLEWDSHATRSASDADALGFSEIDVTPFAQLLVPGANVLAIQGLNSSNNSSEFLLVPELTRQMIGGTLSVDDVDFYGGQLRGVTRVEGNFHHGSGELSPQLPLANSFGPARLLIVGDYTMDPSATLRLDAFDDGIDSIDVQGVARLDGTLSVVNAAGPINEPIVAGTASVQTVLRADQIESSFQSVIVNGAPWSEGHQGAGLFQLLDYSARSGTDSLSGVSR